MNPKTTNPKTALITGASRGLGKALAGFLAQQGYALILTARGAEELERLANELNRATKVIALAGDVSEAQHREALAEACKSGLDILVNNASDLGESPLPELVNTDLERLSELYKTNVLAPLGLVQAALDALEKRQGLIINLSSDAAQGGYEGWGGYGSSKAALDLLTRTLANELKPRGVSAAAVDPGDMRTAMHQAAFPGEDISERPLPDITLPFWAWLLGQAPAEVSGQRFQAQADTWTLHSMSESRPEEVSA